MSTPDPHQSEQLPPGTVVAERYVVDGFLARGGFASIYRGHHRQIGRRVALKVLEPPPRGQQPEEFRRRFLQEAQVAARIEHPGVVDVFDFGELQDGRMYIAMDLLDGHDLDAELRGGPLPASRLVPLFVECLGALHEGHRQGIVHKDLKPSNLFLVRPGEPTERLVILDFGIARVFEDPGARVTRDGGFSGTPAYLAPEYIRHQVVLPALDVYQMGLILIEALTGAPAIVADNSMAFLLAHCLNPVVLPKSLADTELGHVCLRAVAKDPDERYADAGALRAALAAIDTDSLTDTREFRAAAPIMDDARLTDARTLQIIQVTEQQLATLTSLPIPALEIPTPSPVAEEQAREAPAVEDSEAGPTPVRKKGVAALIAGAVLVASAIAALLFATPPSPGNADVELPTAPAVPLPTPASVRPVDAHEDAGRVAPSSRDAGAVLPAAGPDAGVEDGPDAGVGGALPPAKVAGRSAPRAPRESPKPAPTARVRTSPLADPPTPKQPTPASTSPLLLSP